MKGNIFNIQRYCIHDGPGIRTTVFMKGCGMRCFWCHNPESLRTGPELQLFLDKCIGCGKCYDICPAGAHRVADGKREFTRELCIGCGKCADICYAEALVLRGWPMSVKEVIDEVEKDHPFYENSGGGVTFSGGEPLYQKDFLLALLRESKARGLHTVIETAGNAPEEALQAVMPFVDLWLYDLKVFDEVRHREATGVSNQRIHENLRMLAASNVNIIVKIPIVPGVNDNEAELGKIAAFVSGLRSINSVELLPFNIIAGAKYKSLGMPYGGHGIEVPSKESLARFAGIFTELGLNTKVL